MMKFFIIILILSFAFPSVQAQTVNNLTEKVIYSKTVAPNQKLDELYKKLSAAYQNLDAEAAINLYTEDSYSLIPDKNVLYGKAEISADISKYFQFVKNRNKNLSLSFEILERQISGKLAFDVGLYTVTEIRSDGDELKTRGKFIAVARQMPNGDWRFQAKSESYIPPPKSEPARTRNAFSSKLLNISELEKEIDRVFGEQMQKQSIPGAAITVVKDGKIIFAKGYGIADIEKKNPVVADKTIFRIGSITKVFTATTVMQLADNGKIKLSDDVNKYLKNIKVPNTYSEPITFADLLTHSSGLDEITPGRRTSDAAKLVPLGEFLKTRLVRRLPPGEVISYSTYNSALAGYLVEQISGKSLKDYFRANIFEPVEMNRTSLAAVPKELQSDFATGYEVEDGKQIKLPFQWFITYPASDINSTAIDMAHFIIAHLNKGAYKNRRILSRKSAEAMHQKQFSGHRRLLGYTYGFQEWERNNVRFIEHGGSMDDGYSALLSLIPEENFGFFVACNTESGGYGLGTAVKSMLLEKYFPVKTTRETIAKTSPKAHDLERFAGKYQNDIYCHSCTPDSGAYHPQPFEVKINEDGTLAFWGANWRQIEPLVFELASGPRAGQIKIAFRENAKGEITYMFQDWSTYERVP